MKHPRTHALALPATALAAVLALSACGGGEASTGGSASSGASAASSSVDAAEHNEADVMFAQMMIPHHSQAVEMSDVLLAKDDVDERVAALAEEVKAAQAPEIEQMSGWLEEWDEKVPTGGSMEGMDEMEGMDHDMGSMSGMMSADDMQSLDDASGSEASRLFLQQMTEHHTGAVEMAESEITDGQYPEAVDLAETIVTTQKAEIDEMASLLASL